MSTGGTPLPPRGSTVAFACLSMIAAAPMVNVTGAALGFAQGLSESPLGLASVIRTWGPTLFLILPVVGLLAGALGLIVIHRAPRHGWIWLLPAGTVLALVLMLPVFADPVVRVAGVAGPPLLIMGLLGAANWLTHAEAPGAGASVAGVALAAPLLGGLLVFLLPDERYPVDALNTLNRWLMIMSIAAAVGLAALLPWLPRASPPPPARKVTTVGLIAVALPLVPYLVLRIGSAWLRPEDADPFEDSLVLWSILVGLCGFAVLAAVGWLAFRLGPRALAAAAATGLVLYGLDLPHILAWSPFNDVPGIAAWTALGLALGIGFAVSSWRARLAGVACAVTGIGTLVLLVSDPPPAALIGTLIVPGIAAAVATYGSAAVAVAERAEAPAVLGAVAITILFGLRLSSGLLRPTELTANLLAPRPLIVTSGIALLVGALLVVALPRIGRAAPDQAELSPGLAK